MGSRGRLLLAIVLASVVFVAVAHVLVRRVGRNLRYSIFYDFRVASAKKEHEALISASAAFVKSHQFLFARKKRDKKLAPVLCFGIPSIAREYDYLSVLVESVFRHLEHGGERSKIHFVLLSDEHASPRPEDAFFDQLLERAPLSLPPMVPAREADLMRETADYVRVLDACSQSGAQYVLIVQDDMRASKQWLKQVLHVVDMADKRAEGMWSAIKLFYTEYYAGWTLNAALGLTAASVLVVIVSSALSAVFLRKQQKMLLLRSLLVSLWIGLLVGGVFAASCYALGRQHVWKVYSDNYLNPYESSAACAILYQTKYCDALSHFLTEKNADPANAGAGEPVDLEIDEFVNSVNAQKYIYAPSVFQHMGIMTSIRSKQMPFQLRIEQHKDSLTWKLE